MGAMGTPQLTPQALQQFIQMMQQRQQQGGAQPPSGGMPNPQQAQPSQATGGNAPMSEMPPVKTLPGIAPMPQGPQSQTTTRLQGIPAAVMMIKQGMHQQKIQKAKSLTDWFIAMQDPQTKQQVQKAVSGDPKLQKAFEKKMHDYTKMYDKALTDPNSPEGQGVQAAYRAQQQQAQQQQEWQTKQAQIQAIQNQKNALAAEEQRRTQLMGTVTDAERFKEQQKNVRAQATIDSQITRQAAQIAAQNAQLTQKLTVMKQIAEMREGGLNARAGQRQQQSQAAQALYKQAQAQQNELNELERRRKDIADNMQKHPVLDWFSDEGQNAKAQLDLIDGQINQLQGKQQVLFQSFDQMQQVGLIPKAPMTTPAAAAPATPPATNNKTTKGTKDDPHVI